MISTDLLKYLAYIWVTEGYEEFKTWINDLELTNSGFSITEISKHILNDNEIMRYYIQDSAYKISENPVYRTSCQQLRKESIFWYEENSHRF